MGSKDQYSPVGKSVWLEERNRGLGPDWRGLTGGTILHMTAHVITLQETDKLVWYCWGPGMRIIER